MRAATRLPLVLWPLLASGCGLLFDLDPPDDGGLDAQVSFDGGGRDAEVRDAEAFDAEPRDACVAQAELCNGVDDDCDGRVDEAFDLTRDPTHCGTCGRRCPDAGGVASCFAGECAIECDADTADCDGELANGCEARLDDPRTCGGCDAICTSTAPVCAAGPSGFGCVNRCAPPTIPCDGACVNVADDLANCGGCGVACFSDPHGRLECVGGTCVVADCGDRMADCNLDAADGCESSIDAVTSCGACGSVCMPGQTCVVGSCVSG